uniref:Uncharacterized protein n=1 Tax=Cacopsylla melanoneura TaxID=428564 RepID=A0A8D8Y4M8_9HEMI
MVSFNGKFFTVSEVIMPDIFSGDELLSTTIGMIGKNPSFKTGPNSLLFGNDSVLLTLSSRRFIVLILLLVCLPDSLLVPCDVSISPSPSSMLLKNSSMFLSACLPTKICEERVIFLLFSKLGMLCELDCFLAVPENLCFC